MKAYRGVVKDGKVELMGAELPEGTRVTVTVGEPELLLATLLHWLRRGRHIRIVRGPIAGMSAQLMSWPLIWRGGRKAAQEGAAAPSLHRRGEHG